MLHLKHHFILIGFILIFMMGWVIVNFWDIAISSLFFTYFKCDINSPVHTFSIAIGLTLIYIFIIIYVGNPIKSQICPINFTKID
jgi:hypothetical protein